MHRMALVGFLLCATLASTQDSRSPSRPVPRADPGSPEVQRAETRLSAARKDRDQARRLRELEAILVLTDPSTQDRDSVRLWKVRGAAAADLDRWQEGREAGLQLRRLLPARGGDSEARRVVDALALKGWLDPDPAKVAATTRATWAAERLRGWATATPKAVIDPTTGLPKEIVHTATGIVMVLIPAGSFACGASGSDDYTSTNELPEHRVTISSPFYLGKFEVTNAQYAKFDKTHEVPPFAGQKFNAPDQPAVLITWFKAHEFCEKCGLRLPTEAEWEYACRAGTTTRYPWGEDPEGGLGFANLLNEKTKLPHDASKTAFKLDDGFVGTSPVGKFKPNAFGAHDMVGNCWEWVEDWFSSKVYSSWKNGVTDPLFLDEKAASSEEPYRLGDQMAQPPFRIMRGGSFSAQCSECRSAFRAPVMPTHLTHDVGFRVARTP